MKPYCLIITWLLFFLPFWSFCQSSPLGWEGDTLIPASHFYNAGRWTANALSGNYCSLSDNDSCLTINWKLQPGNGQWVQCYYIFDSPVSLSKYDIFGFDMHGSSCEAGNICHKQQVIEIKFEDGIHQAVHTRMGEDGILGVNRWVENQFFHRYDNFFSIPEEFNWDSVRVLSIGIKSHPWINEPLADSGTVSFRVIKADSTAGWARAQQPENLTVDESTLSGIKEDALNFILSRQQSTGLITTWTEDGLSWLYGQGLALKILTIEGVWANGTPMNEAAEAAEKLAHFLADEIQPEGFWPRAWNSYSGEIAVLHEENGSIWMGDFPWALIGLASYFKKSNDCYAFQPLMEGYYLLYTLVEEDGTLYTYNALTQDSELVTSSEAYAAAIGGLLELGNDDLANTLISRIDTDTWDDELRCWREGIYSDRIVLFTNTWLAALLNERGYAEKALEALTLCGKLLYTCGPGTPCGLDGIGPVAVWYEGVLSYIAAGGPGSNELFSGILPYINEDGSVPHYNDNIGGTAGIWAERWASLDGTSWLYFISSGRSPFEILEGPVNMECFEDLPGDEPELLDIFIYPSPFRESIVVSVPDIEYSSIVICDINGRIVARFHIRDPKPKVELNLHELESGMYFLQLEGNDLNVVRALIKTP